MKNPKTEATKEHGNKGNKAAKKPAALKATDYLHQRISAARKARWTLQAQQEGLTLSAWLQKVGDAACDTADEARNEAN